jgi:hypothetical protein
MIMRPQSGRALILAAGRDSCAIKGIDRRAARRGDRDMDRPLQTAFAADPQIRLAVGAEAGRGRVVFILLDLYDQRIAERGQSLQVKRFRSGAVGNGKTGVVEHRALSNWRGAFVANSRYCVGA